MPPFRLTSLNAAAFSYALPSTRAQTCLNNAKTSQPLPLEMAFCSIIMNNPPRMACVIGLTTELSEGR